LAHNSSISSSQTTRGRELPEHGLRSDSRLGRIIRILADNATVVVSGTKLAHEMDTSRSEVWRLVQQLRAFGVEITGHPATGYQLASVPDLLLPEALEPLVKGTMFGRDIHHYFRVGSTNIEGMQAAGEGAPEGSVFLAEEQTAGRGRAGHSWVSEPSTGIYVSLLLRPQIAPADAVLLSLIAGIAAFDAVVETTGIRPDIRWPNDLLIGDKKFCGILTEMNAEVTRVRYAVVGIGINVNQSRFPSELDAIATSLQLAAGHSWSRVALTAALLKSFDSEYRHLISRDVAEARRAIFERFQQRSSYARGKRVHVNENGGYDGITAGLDDRGFLQVETDAGMRTVLSGDVRPVQ
jgi:BirA family transcriptional regulator, biotin operon repressor / biotin---[acetyl-CoA-carboxylase] ligase